MRSDFAVGTETEALVVGGHETGGGSLARTARTFFELADFAGPAFGTETAMERAAVRLLRLVARPSVEAAQPTAVGVPAHALVHVFAQDGVVHHVHSLVIHLQCSNQY